MPLLTGFWIRACRGKYRLPWILCLLPLIPTVLFAAEPLFREPSARPAEIPPEEWQRLFGGRPQVIEAQVHAADGATYYSIIHWNPEDEDGAGPIGSYVRVKAGKAIVLWTNDVIDGPPQPPWTAAGLTFPEAVEMEKQLIRKYVGDAIQKEGREAVAECWRKRYDRKPGTPIRDFEVYASYYYPEHLEAARELGLLPKDFILPALAPEDQHILNARLGIEKAKPPTRAEEACNQAAQKSSPK
ncbi:hypothetical protein [Methylacidimicrobium sp. B4]|uniref:hypothetical protein n=1 Tax=Methylacidimicrobium sp. B4 TaxID=2796139 RepID=UPI001A8CC29B|nr:hypothetical protein [Methylacidimicrobium sp. B4]QSR85047.1 hypothetical protein MacB4_01895 [Methylacidimicrobium sp. B4]